MHDSRTVRQPGPRRKTAGDTAQPREACKKETIWKNVPDDEAESLHGIWQMPAGKEAIEMRKAVAMRGIQDTFTEADAGLLDAFVEKVVVWRQEKAVFHFTCGLVVTLILTV